MSALISIETLIITAVLLLLYASWRLRQKQKYYRNVTSKLPTIGGLPFIGQSYHLFNVDTLLGKISAGFESMKTSTACIWMATTPYVLTIDPEIIKHVTTSPEFLNKARDLYTHFDNGVLNGIIVSPVNKWKTNRKAISPFLAHTNILGLFPYFNENAVSVKNKLERLAGLGEQDIYTSIKECGLQLSLLTIMGVKIEEDSVKYKELLTAFTDFLDHMSKTIVLNSFGLGFLSNTPHYKRTVKYLQALVRTLIKENLAENVESEAISYFEENRHSMIHLALKALQKKVFSKKDVEIECFTMLAASYETSVGAAYTCLVMLAMHPEIQERVLQEIRSVFPDGITTVQYDDLKKFPYLDMVISESLRLVPPITILGREVEKDTELCPGVILPKDAQVYIPIYILHTCKEIWGPDAHCFNPDNFLPENIEKRHPYSYMVFSKGPRNCIGFRYAEITLRIMLIHLVRNLKFSTTTKFEDIVLIPKVTMTYKNEPQISIEVRAD
ncbi:probable cytochrome P450 313a4 [Bactrocera neohumeralis]|uniref:probable cytochrome P450 313a4 n=1 Tax=Bactrocera neohumeralis TaxID=98809 RepID=UPI002164F54B|nr:probable cytochrome P450 313a4 [Bactrocera neohumeralis]